MPKVVLVGALLLLGSSLALLDAETVAPVEGVVFLDRNTNGLRDPDEPGLAGIAVSNQREVVRTAADGRYRLDDAGLGVVFVSLPDTYRAVGSFWRAASGVGIDFALAPQASPAAFTFLHASDPHVSAQSLPRLERVRAIVGDRKPDFVLMTGDLVRDSLRVGEDEARGYYDLYVNEVGRWPVTVWSVPGNHENFGVERHLSHVSTTHPLYGKRMYRQRLGPNYYSFSYGGVHFVGLDSVDVDDEWYYGHIDQAQLAWLKADLATLARDATVVTFNHIPFASAMESVSGFKPDGVAPSLISIGGRPQYRHTVSNLSEVLPLLQPYRWTHALGGHLHIRESIRFGSAVTTRFYQTAAIVGPTEGVVPAVSGVTFYRVRNGVVDEGEFVALDTASSHP